MATNGHWTANDIPDLSGKIAIVTGANSGLGYKTTLELARHGAHVVMASRDLGKGQIALEELQDELPDASLELMQLDLANLASVRAFADGFYAQHQALDLLINNAGVMGIPYQKTADGFEMQFGVNHLGHFALTGQLLNAILSADAARVVAVSSGFHHRGKMDYASFQGNRAYDRWAAYSQSKLANLLFAYELQRKFEACGAVATSVAAHPGYAATNLQFVGPRMEGSKLKAAMMALSNRLFAQNAAMGALPILCAATAPNVNGCDYIGPGGFREARGYPAKVASSKASYDAENAAELWSVSENLTGIKYSIC